jgi:hypothetical protein
MKLEIKTSDLFILAGLLSFFFGFAQRQQTFDIHIHDTYFIFTALLAYGMMAAIFFIFGILYRTFPRILFFKHLTWVHLILSLLPLSFLLLLTYNIENNTREGTGFRLWASFSVLSRHIALLILVFILGQFIFIIHLLLGTFRRPR